MLQRLHQPHTPNFHALHRFRSCYWLLEIRERKWQKNWIDLPRSRSRTQSPRIGQVRVKQRHLDFIAKLPLGSFLDAWTWKACIKLWRKHAQRFQTVADVNANNFLPDFSITKRSEDDSVTSSRTSCQLVEIIHIDFRAIIQRLFKANWVQEAFVWFLFFPRDYSRPS